MIDYLTIAKCLTLPETQALERQPTRFTLAQAAASGQLPAIKPGSEYLITKPDYLTWLAGFPHKPGRKGNRND